MNELQPLETKLNALIANLNPKQRTLLSRHIGRKLATSQRQRIAKQQQPDGSPFAPRKKQVRSKKGKIKQQAMFQKLRRVKFLRSKGNSNEASVGFAGSAAHIAKVHQFGLKGRVSKSSDYKVQYEKRELLGISKEDMQVVEDLVIEFLAS